MNEKVTYEVHRMELVFFTSVDVICDSYTYVPPEEEDRGWTGYY